MDSSNTGMQTAKAGETKSEPVVKIPVDDKKKSSKLPLPLVIAFGCLGLLVISGITISIFFKLFISKIGSAFIQKGIESRTGIKVETGGAGGKEGLSFTDTKTGAKINLGAEKIPDGFPSDFPLYPKSKPSGSFSGLNRKDQGFWVMLSSTDSLDSVTKYYAENLPLSGWGGKELLKVGGSVTFEVKKTPYAGSLTVSREEKDKDTKIMIILGNEKDNTGEANNGLPPESASGETSEE